MNAEVLREAARLMRFRAESATRGEWHHLGNSSSCEEAGHRAGSSSTWVSADHRSTLHVESGNFGRQATYDGQHFAAWSPSVAHLLADWLDRVALAAHDDCIYDQYDDALPIAVAYLGRTP